MRIEKLADVDLIKSFLTHHKESSLFLLSNLKEFGPDLGEHLNSGDYFGVFSNERLVSVFSVTRRGNLIFQSGEFSLDAKEVIKFVTDNSEVSLRGCIGSHEIAFASFELLLQQGLVPSYSSKEVLYSMNLQTMKCSIGVKECRLLDESSFEMWLDLQRRFSVELKLESDLESDYYLKIFKEKISHVGICGVFEGEVLVSCAHLNAHFEDTGQVGGVFTIPQFRRRGFSRLCMEGLMKSAANYGIGTMVLFTGEENFSAQSLYENLGFNKVGDFGLYIGNIA